MKLKAILQDAMTNLGVTPEELMMLSGRMTFSVTALEAQKTALEAQIATLSAQRDEVVAELQRGMATMAKLVDPDV